MMLTMIYCIIYICVYYIYTQSYVYIYTCDIYILIYYDILICYDLFDARLGFALAPRHIRVQKLRLQRVNLAVSLSRMRIHEAHCGGVEVLTVLTGVSCVSYV